MTSRSARTAVTKTKRRTTPKNVMLSAEPLSPRGPSLRFSPLAWAKLLYLRDYGDTEVGGFAITASDDPLLVEDVKLVKQVCTWVHVAFDDESVADFFDEQVDAGRRMEQFGRIWIHTHPGDSPQPSATDEETFARVFGRSQWAVMFILARQGQSYARLRYNVGPGDEFELPVGIDYSQPFTACEPERWEVEYLENVRPEETVRAAFPGMDSLHSLPLEEEPGDDWFDAWADYLENEEPVKGQ